MYATTPQNLPPPEVDRKVHGQAPVWVDPLSADHDGLPGDPGTPPARLALVDLLEEARSTPMRAGDRATVLDLIGRIERRACPRAERDLRSLLGCA